MRLRDFAMTALLLTGLVSPALAASGLQDQPAPKPPPEEEGIPDNLSFERRGLEIRRFELNPYIGNFVGDKLSSALEAGLNLQLNLTKSLGLTTDFTWVDTQFDTASGIGSNVTNRNLYQYYGGFIVTFPAVFRTGKGVSQADMFTTIGGGATQFKGSFGGGGYVGGGMKIRFRKAQWIGIRVEIRNYFQTINNPGGSDFNSDFIFMAGPSFMIPPEL